MPRKKDRWPELCEAVAADDGLPIRKTGAWTEEKVHFWSKYVEIVTTALWGKPQWPGGLVYLDLFAGPGVCQLDETKKRFPGSALVAASQRRPFTRLIACELKEENTLALSARLSKTELAKRSHVLQGDCNELISEACSLIPDKSLTLAFVDPEGLQAKFETLQTLTNNRNVDLLILFPDSYDILRNIEGVYEKQDVSKLDEVLGPDSEWRTRWKDLPSRTRDNTCQLFRQIYQEQLERHLGYSQFRHKVVRMRSKKVRLYTLIFASRHELGTDFWDKAVKRDVAGERELPGF